MHAHITAPPAGGAIIKVTVRDKEAFTEFAPGCSDEKGIYTTAQPQN